MIADGGCTCPGDVSKAFAAGADFVMLGGMLAHEEGANTIISKFHTGEYESVDGEMQPNLKNSIVQFYGMIPIKREPWRIANYRSSEGRTVEVAQRFCSRNSDLLGGIRSTAPTSEHPLSNNQ